MNLTPTSMKNAISLAACLIISASAVRAATLFTFESGFIPGQTTFTQGDLSVTLSGGLSVMEFPTFGSGEGDWFIDSGYGLPVAGSAGSIVVSTSSIAGFRLTGLDLWTSNDAGNNFTPGNVTLTGNLAGGGSFSAILAVNPTGNGGLNWDTTNDLSAFSGKTLTSIGISLGTGINYLAIDNLALESVASIPEPGAMALTLLAGGALLLRRKP